MREYSKTDPHWVRAFVVRNSDKLSVLSQKEALKRCGKGVASEVGEGQVRTPKRKKETTKDGQGRGKSEKKVQKMGQEKDKTEREEEKQRKSTRRSARIALGK